VTQEQLDLLMEDALDLHMYGDLYEVAQFIEALADKYNLDATNISKYIG